MENWPLMWAKILRHSQNKVLKYAKRLVKTD